MLKKIINIFYIVAFFIFIFLLTNFYFSDQNISKTNKLRSFYLSSLVGSEINVPLLKNDTKNIVEYKNDIEVYKKKKKYNLFWDLIEK